MTNRQAMQMALEALNLPSMKTMQMLQQLDEVITALRAALEQPEQEPVAWLSQAGNFLSPLEFTVGDAALYGWTPVYTTPPAPQRKPLSDEQYNAIQTRLSRMDSGLWSRGGTSERKLLEAIWEAAHGIKGEL